MADHKHGEMDTRAQQKTFAGFIRMVTWATIIILVSLVLLALANG